MKADILGGGLDTRISLQSAHQLEPAVTIGCASLPHGNLATSFFYR